MKSDDSRWRSQLARELTSRTRAKASEVMGADIAFGGSARRVGMTGPPGAGKSSLIAQLTKLWLELGQSVGVLAIDPSSPVSGGSLLGDRIRMEDVADNPLAYIRSLSSAAASDGLCPNILSHLDAFEQAEFDTIILETVGVGQVSYEAKPLVDTFVLVLVPESGDTIQAMKAGILEVADIYVVNKSDRPAAAKLAGELRSMAAWRGHDNRWVPPVILASATSGTGIVELSDAIDAHRKAALTDQRRQDLVDARRDYHLRSILLHQLNEVLEANAAELRAMPLAESFRFLLDRLGSA